MTLEAECLESLLKEVKRLDYIRFAADKYYLGGKEIFPYILPGAWIVGPCFEPWPDLIVPDIEERKESKRKLKDFYRSSPYLDIRVAAARCLGYSKYRKYANELKLCLCNFFRNGNPSFIKL
jgi:hypothetical protein